MVDRLWQLLEALSIFESGKQKILWLVFGIRRRLVENDRRSNDTEQGKSLCVDTHLDNLLDWSERTENVSLVCASSIEYCQPTTYTPSAPYLDARTDHTGSPDST